MSRVGIITTELEARIATLEAELAKYRAGDGYWTNESGEQEPSAKTFRAMWNGLRTKLTEVRADLDTLRDPAGRYRAALEDAAQRFTVLHRMAVNPMKSWDAGRVVDAQRVEDEAGDALEAIELATALAATPGTATTEPQSEKLRWRAEKISAADSRERPALPCEPCQGTGACPGGCGRAIPHACDACMGDGRAPATPVGKGAP